MTVCHRGDVLNSEMGARTAQPRAPDPCPYRFITVTELLRLLSLNEVINGFLLGNRRISYEKEEIC